MSFFNEIIRMLPEATWHISKLFPPLASGFIDSDRRQTLLPAGCPNSTVQLCEDNYNNPN